MLGFFRDYVIFVLVPRQGKAEKSNAVEARGVCILEWSAVTCSLFQVILAES